MAPIISVRGLHVRYANGTHALRGLDLDVAPGEFCVVIGLSGSGKSTFLRCINRLVQPTAGQVSVAGQDVTHISGNELRRLRAEVGMIFQHFNLIKRKSVIANVLTGALARTGTLASLLESYAPADRQLAFANLKRVGLAEKAHARADQLSGGQQQRVAIARTLMQRPKILLADEPVASLDPATSHSVLDHLRDINRSDGVTVLCNIHFLSLAREYGSRVVALKDGQLVFDGKPHEITDEKFKQIYGEQAVEVQIR
jgi:phosphonate transport system ATP-binding protein